MSIDQLSSSAGEAVVVHNPATGGVVGSVAVQSAEAVAAVVGELRSPQPSWEALGPDARAVWLRKLRNWLLDNESRLVDVPTSETGKPRAEAPFEIMVTYDAINYYADRARKYLAEKKFRPHGPLTAPKKLTSGYRPYAVVGVITPWNFPLIIPGVDAVPALLAGAAVLYCRQQAITTPRVPRMQNQLLWYPYSPRRSRTVAALLRLLVARDLRRRLFHGAHSNRTGVSP